MGWHEAVLDFWFGLDEPRRWGGDPALDAEIIQRFGRLWQTEQFPVTPAKAGASESGGVSADHNVDRHLASCDHALAATILFDQFPRNMFRNDRRAVATDSLARHIADGSIARGHDAHLPPERRLFLYLPFEHSEALADQERAVKLIQPLGNDQWTLFARKHRDVIARFGRFPHRNALLGRESTDEERAFGLEAAW